MGLMYMSKATECINKYFKSLNKKITTFYQ